MTEESAKTELQGVKGLVDSDITEVPPSFHYPSSTISNNRPSDISGLNLTVPIIDLREINNNERNVVVSKIKDAAEKWGFFQVINHGVPLTVLEEIKQAVRRFHELDPEVKNNYSHRDFNKKFIYNQNFDLNHSSPMNWRDSFVCYIAPDPPNPDDIPIACR